MEIGLSVLIEAGSKQLADFIDLVWDVDNAPVEAEEVEPELHQAFEALEFIDEPLDNTRVSDTRLSFFYDAVSDMDVMDDHILPYNEAGVKKMIVVIYGDEGEDWYLIDAQGKNRHLSRAETTFKDCDNDDIDTRMKLVADKF